MDVALADVARAAAVVPGVEAEPKRRTRPPAFARWLLRPAFAAVVTAAIATLLARSSLFADIVCSFRWQTGWCALGIAAALALFRMRVRALIAFVASVYLLAPVMKASLAGRDEPVAGTQLRVVSANVFFGNNSIEAMRAWLLEEHADVLAVQELPHSWREDWGDLTSAYPTQLVWPSDLRGWHDVGFGIALFTRLPVVTSRVISLRPDCVPMLEMVVRVGEREVTVRTMHPPSPQSPGEWNRRNDVLLRAAQQVEWNAECALLADFNTSSGSPQFADLIGQTNLRDSRRGFGRLPTWKTEWLIPGLWVDLDHILVGDSLRVLARDTATIPGSDHIAARATLVIQPR